MKTMSVIGNLFTISLFTTAAVNMLKLSNVLFLTKTKQYENSWPIQKLLTVEQAARNCMFEQSVYSITESFVE